MWQRFSLYDLRVIGHYLGTLTQLFAALMAVPFITALVFQEWEPAERYLLGIGIALVVGTLLQFLRIEPGRLGRRQALAVTGFAWIVLAFFASVPLFLSGHYATYMDALFDGVSGLTTTGATVALDIDHFSNADNMFRFMMHLVGGLGLIVVALSLGIFGKRSGSSLYTAEGRSEHVVPNVVQTTQLILRITLVIIFIAAVVLTALCISIGMEPVRAVLQSIWLAISAFTTGGFAPMAESVSYYNSIPIEVFLMLLMILGSISFVVHAEVWKGRLQSFFGDIEIRTMLIWLLVMTVVVAASLSASALFSDLPAMIRRGLFMVVSAFSTTGFQNVTTNQLTTVFSSGAFLALALIAAVGGSAGSTAGGVKLHRVGIIFKSIVSTVKEAVSPSSARVVVSYNHLGRRVLSSDAVKEAMTVFVLFVITYSVGALVGIAHGYEASQAIMESVSMTSNGGIITGIVTPGMSPSLEAFYIFQMWAGRLEFVTLLAVLAEIIASLAPRKRRVRQ
ncbi:TrkH family potassium uptake protein [Ellagibacter isourolithinifaciens]|uniref:TrkH family potassium uptake protein n=1 Tax=Ellagibacter isourolithinifaciens TaxID=2137581 RepID=A0A6N6NTG9_9ACTN|nr:potassium transporter TrkG [Ellagibacter isourolithinifaciens]KAB1641321.1 TrkH family potassium uptake protein [Ellagibacter isourolithinifaciens]